MRPRSCSRTKASRQAGASGAKLAPVIATSRPPCASRASAEATWRKRRRPCGPRRWPSPRKAGSSPRRSARWRDRDDRRSARRRSRVTAMAGKRKESNAARVSASSLRTSEPPASLGEDGEQPGAGRGLQHTVGRRDRCCCRDGEAERDRRRELLDGPRSRPSGACASAGGRRSSPA